MHSEFVLVEFSLPVLLDVYVIDQMFVFYLSVWHK